MEPVNRLDIIEINSPAFEQNPEQVVEQRHVAARFQRKVKIGHVTTGGAAWIDDHDLGAMCLTRRQKPLIKHRVTPGQV